MFRVSVSWAFSKLTLVLSWSKLIISTSVGSSISSYTVWRVVNGFWLMSNIWLRDGVGPELAYWLTASRFWEYLFECSMCLLRVLGGPATYYSVALIFRLLLLRALGAWVEQLPSEISGYPENGLEVWEAISILAWFWNKTFVDNRDIIYG